MKKITLIISIILSITCSFAQVGIGTTTPDASSSLDISSNNSGLLVPRINLASVVDTATIPSPATSLLVYNTNAAINFGYGVGYYYWNGTQWEKLQTSNSNAWSLTGNSGTNPATNFIGTTDDNDLVFKRNNIEAGRISFNRTSLGMYALYNSPAFSDNNTAIGFSALKNNLNGFNNVATGSQSLLNNISGHHNTSTGVNSLLANTHGINNTANGFGSLSFNLTGSNNTAIGFESLKFVIGDNNTGVGSNSLIAGGYNNTALGSGSLGTNNTANDNTAIGYLSLGNNLWGVQNTAVGVYSLQNNSTGNGNTAIGSFALFNNITSDQNTAIGWNSMGNGIGIKNTAVGYKSLNNTNGNFNTALGWETMAGFSSLGEGNTSVGYQSLLSGSGSYNTSLGFESLRNSSGGSYNISIGNNSLNSLTNGNSNIGIGPNAEVPNAAGNYQMSIANVIYGKDLNSTLNGKIGIGVPNPSEKLEINGKIKITDGTEGVNKILTSDANGVGTWTASSATKFPVFGTFGTGATFYTTSAGQYTTASITLPPGKWAVSATLLILGDQVFGPPPFFIPTPRLSTGQSLWMRTYFSDSPVLPAATTNYIPGSSSLISGSLTGPEYFGLVNGTVFIENNSGGNKPYYLWAGFENMGAVLPANFQITGFGSGYGEDQIIAIPMN